MSSANAIRRRVNSVGCHVRDMLQGTYHHHISYHRVNPIQDIQELETKQSSTRSSGSQLFPLVSGLEQPRIQHVETFHAYSVATTEAGSPYF